MLYISRTITSSIACTLSTLLLSGCVSYSWVKPGADNKELEHQIIACKARALQALPPNVVVTGSHTNATRTIKKNCHQGKKDCATASYDEREQTKDVNDDARDVLIKNCMFEHGWEQIEIKN